MKASRPSRWTLLFAAGLVSYYAGWVAIWLAGGSLYFWAMRWFGIDAVMVQGYAAPLPFFDLEGVLSWSECARRGYDVLAVNPCDPISRTMNYSPLFAHPLLGRIGVGATVPLGFAIDAAFLAVLVLVVRPRNATETLLGWLVACSPAFVYAFDRCNFDLVVFVTVATVILVSSPRNRHRLTAAAGFVLGLLKFYPFCLMLVTLRERLKTVLIVAGGSLVALALFAYKFRHAFPRMSFPAPDWFGDTFSARQFVLGIADLAHIRPSALYPLLVIMLAAAGVAAWRLSRRLDALLPPGIWAKPAYALLLFASVVMVSCFLVQTNINYRAVYLIGVVPGLWRLEARAEAELRRLIGWTVAALIACLWAEMARVDMVLVATLVGGPGHPLAASEIEVATLLVREPLWWFVMTVLAAIILSFVRQSKAVAGLLRRTA